MYVEQNNLNISSLLVFQLPVNAEQCSIYLISLIIPLNIYCIYILNIKTMFVTPAVPINIEYVLKKLRSTTLILNFVNAYRKRTDASPEKKNKLW